MGAAHDSRARGRPVPYCVHPAVTPAIKDRSSSAWLLGTIAVLAVILIVALERSSTVATADPTPVPTTAPVSTAPGVPTIAIAPVTNVNHPVAGSRYPQPWVQGSAKAVSHPGPRLANRPPTSPGKRQPDRPISRGLRGHVVLLDFLLPGVTLARARETWLTELLQAYSPSGLEIGGSEFQPLRHTLRGPGQRGPDHYG